MKCTPSLCMPCTPPCTHRAPGCIAPMELAIVLVQGLEKAGGVGLLSKKSDAEAGILSGRGFEHLLREPRRMVVKQEDHWAEDGLAPSCHRGITVLRDLTVELLQVLHKSLLRLHTIVRAREYAHASLHPREVADTVRTETRLGEGWQSAHHPAP